MSGPPTIAKYVKPQDSHYTAVSFIGRDGHLKKQSNEKPFPSIAKDDPFGLMAFNVAYSENRRKRWLISEMAREKISELQEPWIGLKVTFTKAQIDDTYNTGLQLFPRRLFELAGEDARFFTEYHASDGEAREIHRIAKCSRLRELKNAQNPARRRRGRKIRHQIPQALETEALSRKEQDEVPYWERKAHIYYRELVVEYVSRKRINTIRSHETHRSRREKFAYLTSNEQKNAIKQTIKREQKDWCEDQEAECIFEEAEEADIEAGTNTDFKKPKQSFLSDFLAVSHRTGKKRMKKRYKSTERSAWFLDKPHMVETVSEGIEPIYSLSGVQTEGLLTLPTLPSFLFPLPSNDSLLSFMTKESIDYRLIDRMKPLSYLVESERISSHSSLNSFIPYGFLGFVILQQYPYSDSRKFIRCIINQRESTGNDQVSAVRSSEFRSVTSSYASLDEFVELRVFTAEDAEEYAANQLFDEMPSCSTDQYAVTNDDEYYFCRVCYAEEVFCIALQCGHYFCASCWVSHATICLKQGRIPIKCLEYDCSSFIGYDQMMVIMPVRSCEKYRKLLSRRRRMRDDWIDCTRCSNAIHITVPNKCAKLARCSCGQIICTKCKNTAHAPLSCYAFHEYDKALRTNGDALKTVRTSAITVVVKKCPTCSEFCVRSSGCNHIMCPCGEEFCYMCCQKWSPSKHYNCSTDNSVSVALYDVAKNVSNISRRVLEECLLFREAQSSLEISRVWKQIQRYPGPVHEKIQFLRIFIAACQTMEMCNAHLYFLGRRLKRSIGRKALSATVQLNFARRLFSRLKFQTHLMKMHLESGKSDHTVLKSDTVMVEKTIRDIITETC